MLRCFFWEPPPAESPLSWCVSTPPPTRAPVQTALQKQMRLVHRQLSLPVQREEFRQQILRNVLQGTLALLDLDLERDEERVRRFGEFNDDSSSSADECSCCRRSSSSSFYLPWIRALRIHGTISSSSSGCGTRKDDERIERATASGTLRVVWMSFGIRRTSPQIKTYSSVGRARRASPKPSSAAMSRDCCTGSSTSVGSEINDGSGASAPARSSFADQRRISHFEDVRSIIFLVALSDYDCVLEEEPTQNAMQESLTLFDSICHSPWFRKTSMVVFLNKIDLFKARLLVSPIRDHFPDYVGGTDEMKGREYFRSKILGLNRTMKPICAHSTPRIEADDTVDSHYTLAIDTTSLVPILMTVQK